MTEREQEIKRIFARFLKERGLYGSFFFNVRKQNRTMLEPRELRHIINVGPTELLMNCFCWSETLDRYIHDWGAEYHKWARFINTILDNERVWTNEHYLKEYIGKKLSKEFQTCFKGWD